MNGMPYCVPWYWPFSANCGRKSADVSADSTSEAGSSRPSPAKFAYASMLRMSGCWLVDTRVVIFWLMSVQLTVCRLPLPPGLAASKRVIRSCQKPFVLSEYSGTSRLIVPPPGLAASPLLLVVVVLLSLELPPHAATVTAQRAA